MIIEKLHVWAHGKLNDLELEFSPSLNVIYGENEAGKSTLQNFIIAMVYGPLRHDIKQKRYENEVLLKKPWNGERWGGTIRFRLDNGGIYEVVRDFGKKTVNVYDEFGNDITNKFSRTRNGDSNFAEELLGVDKTIFKDTVFICQNMVDSLSNRESLKDRIQAIVSTGSEDISSKFAVEKLENALNKIGTRHALSKPLGSYANKLKELGDELEKSKKTFKEILEKLEELQNLRLELTQLTETKRNLEYAELVVSKNDLEEKIKAVEETQKEIDELMHILREKEILEIDKEDFQAAVALNAKRAELSEQLRKLKAELGEYQVQMRKLESTLPVYADKVSEFIEKLEETYKELQIEKSSLESIKLVVSKNDLEEKIKAVEETQKEIDELMHILREKEILEIDKEDFQAAVALNAKRAELSEQLRKLKAELGEYQVQMRKLESTLPVYADKVSEFIEKLEETYKELQIEKSSLESIEDQIKALSKDKEELSKTLSELSRFKTVSEEEVNELLESKTREQYYEEWAQAKKEKIEANKLQIELLERSRYLKRRNSLILSVLGTLMGISPVLGAPTIMVLIGGLLVIAALLYLKGAPKAEEIDNLRKEVSKLRKELESMSLQDKSKELLHRFGVASKEEFLEKYRKFKSISGKLDLINQDVERLQKRRDETIDKIRLHIEAVKDIFSKIGLEFDDSEDESKINERIEKITSSIDMAIKDLKSVLEAKKSLESIRGQITRLEEEVERVKNNLRKTEDELSRILSKYSVESFDDLKRAYDEYAKASNEISELNKLKAKRSALLGDKSLEDYKNELEELKQEIERVKDKIRLHIEAVKDIFSKIGLEFDDSEDESKINERIEKITSSIDMAIKDLKSVLEAKKSLESIRGQITRLEEEVERVKNNLRKTEDELSRILSKYSVESFDDLKRAYDEYAKASNEISELNKLKAKRSALLGDKSLEDYKNELEELKQEIERVKGDRTYIRLSKEEIKANLKEVRERIVQLREQIKINEGRIEILEKSYKPIQEIEEAIAEVKEKVNELEMCRDALEIAKKTLIEAERDFTKDFVRVLNERISPVVKMVTGKYSDIRVDDDLDVNVRDPEHKIFAKCDYLSRGAIDQIYFILKVTIAEMLTRNYESLPLIIDDIFANYDPQRLENGLKLLIDLSAKYQVIFFTCHKYQVDLLEKIATERGLQMSNEDVTGLRITKISFGN
ncbi:AAA family ATPase [Geoglobus acetivorans]|uniref:AAA family ATPase n=1 Tax=Geoglobus acetivorans TaxID=565033 RepID=A0ABZ3H069_GEOAI|nr:AAA family ATPase [Geoglobus acetivorans]